MRKISKDGVILCTLQAETFEKSVEKMDTSSEIFIRRFMKSEIAKRFDNESILESNIQANDILELINEEYGISNYGSVKYTRNEMFWIGYIYRYFAFTYNMTSAQIYKINAYEINSEFFCRGVYWTAECGRVEIPKKN